MAARLTDTLLYWQVPQNEGEPITRAYWLAMERRREHLGEHHPALLHPARSILILVQDVNVRDARVLCAAALLDTYAPELAPSLANVAAEFGEEVARCVAEVPAPGTAGDELLEQLLVAEPDIQLIALAERLDFARHLHLITKEGWAAEHALISGVYLPVAQRVNSVLERRFAWWADAFARRRLGG